MAHPGMAWLAPESTRLAIEACAEDFVEWAHIDVRLTRDGRNVIVHEDRLVAATTGEGPIAGLILAELQGLDARAWFAPRFAGSRMLLLSEAALPQYRGTPQARDPARALAKLTAGLDGPVTVDLAHSGGAAQSSCVTADDEVDPGTFRTLARGTLRRKRLRPRHWSASGGGEAERDVDPYFLACVDGRCHLRGEVRMFAPGRTSGPSGRPTSRSTRRATSGSTTTWAPASQCCGACRRSGTPSPAVHRHGGAVRPRAGLAP